MITLVFNLFFRKLFSAKAVVWKLIFEGVSLLVTLAVIYFASESFSLKVNLGNKEGISLFVFLLVGEIALIVPMNFAERFLTHFLEIKNQQFLLTLVGLRISPKRFVLSRTLPDMFFPISRVFFILIFSYLFLNFHFTLLDFLNFFILEILTTILFGYMALITTMIYSRFNRGIGLFYTLQSFAAILGGAYFPINVFPSYIKNISIFLPQTQILKIARAIFQSQTWALNSVVILITWMLVLLSICKVLESYTIRRQKLNARFI